MIVSIILGYLVALLLRLPRVSVGAFVQGAYRSNLAYVGLPVVLLSLAASHSQPMSGGDSLAVLAIAFLIPVYNLTAVVVLLAGRPMEPGAGHAARQILRAMVTNPLVLSCAAGLLFVAFGWKLPPVIRQTCATLGQMGTPLALLSIGASLTFASLRYQIVPTSAASLIKVAARPCSRLPGGSLAGLVADGNPRRPDLPGLPDCGRVVRDGAAVGIRRQACQQHHRCFHDPRVPGSGAQPVGHVMNLSGVAVPDQRVFPPSRSADWPYLL